MPVSMKVCTFAIKWGVVIRAYKNGLASLEEAKRFILALQDISSLFVTRAIVELAIVELHRRVDNK